MSSRQRPSPLRRLRREMGWRRIDIAAAAHVGERIVTLIEQLDVAGMRLSSLVKVAAAVGKSPVDLVPGLGRAPRSTPAPPLVVPGDRVAAGPKVAARDRLDGAQKHEAGHEDSRPAPAVRRGRQDSEAEGSGTGDGAPLPPDTSRGDLAEPGSTTDRGAPEPPAPVEPPPSAPSSARGHRIPAAPVGLRRDELGSPGQRSEGPADDFFDEKPGRVPG